MVNHGVLSGVLSLAEIFPNKSGKAVLVDKYVPRYQTHVTASERYVTFKLF